MQPLQTSVGLGKPMYVASTLESCSYKQLHSSLSLAFASQFIPSDVFVNLVSLLQTGLRPVDFWGNCYMSNTTDVELAVVDPHKVINSS